MKKRKGSYTRERLLSDINIYVYTLSLSLICWVVGYIYSIGYPVYGEVSAQPLWNVICRVLPGKSVTYLIGLTLTVGGGFLIQRANQELMLIREKSFLPFVLYILLISTNPDFFPLKSTSLGIFCLILAMYELFISYHDETSRTNAFNATFLIGIGSLLWVHILWFIPVFWYGMYSFKSLNVRTFLASLVGFLTVYWFVLGWSVWTGDFTPFTIAFSTLTKIRLLMITEAEWGDWIGVLYIAILTTIASLNIITHEYADSLRTRQFLWFLIIFALFAFSLFFIYEQSSEEYLVAACMPASILLGHFFTVMHNRIVYWCYHFTVILLVGVLFMRLWNFL